MTSLKIPTIRDNLMWDLWMSKYHNPIIAVALDFKLFEWLKGSPLNSEELAAKLNIQIRGAEILAEPLVGLGLLNKRNQQYSLTPTAQTYLLADSPFY